MDGFAPSGKLASPIPTTILACLAAMICYYSVEVLPVLGLPPEHIESFWPGTPFLVAVLLLAPRKSWPLLIGAGLAGIVVAGLREGVTITSEIWLNLGNLVEVLIATLWINRLFKGAPDLRSVNALATYGAVAVIIAPSVSALAGAKGAYGGYWLEWRLWFFGDALGFLTVTPAILSWARDGRTWARDPRNYLELTALVTWLVLFGYLAFMGTGWRNSPALLYLLVPPLLWAALRLGLKGVSTSMLVIAFLAIWGAAHDRGPFTGQGPLNNVLSLQLFLFFAAIPFMVLAVLAEEEKQTRQQLIDEQAQLSTMSQRLIEAQEKERARIARELHDDINQQVALLAVRLDGLNVRVSAHELKQEVVTAKKQVVGLGSDIQALSHRLHSSKLEHLGLASAAAGYCRESSELQKVTIDFQAENIPSNLSPEISLCLFRVLQEAVQNAIKHSGSQHVQVSLLGGADGIKLTVQDSGIGFEPAEAIKGRGLGLTSMKERLKLVDGQISIDSKPQHGTTIQVRVPLPPEMKSAAAGGR